MTVLSVIKQGKLYLVIATPPSVDSAWSTDTPVERQVLIDKLKSLGAHISDIGDVLNEADTMGKGRLGKQQ